MTAPQCEPNFKSRPLHGECGCQRETCDPGQYRVKPNRDGRYHVKACTCPSCRGKRNRQQGLRKQTKAVKGLNVMPVGTLRPGQEEHLQGPVRTEAKSGAAGGANKVWTAYRNARAQSEAQRPRGDNRPFLASFVPDGVNKVLYVVELEDLEAVVFGLAEAWVQQ